MPYDLVTIASAPLQLDATSERARAWIADGEGQLLGAWRTEIGGLFDIKLLRRFDHADAFDRERRRAVTSPRPFGIDDPTAAWRADGYERFPFLPDIVPSARGPFYEFRTYFLKPGGLPPTLSAWQAAVGPAHDYTRHLVVNLFGVDGRPRITHVWGFSSLEERAELRARHYAAGLWPPKGGPEQIAEATSTICLPERWSPLR